MVAEKPLTCSSDCDALVTHLSENGYTNCTKHMVDLQNAHGPQAMLLVAKIGSHLTYHECKAALKNAGLL